MVKDSWISNRRWCAELIGSNCGWRGGGGETIVIYIWARDGGRRRVGGVGGCININMTINSNSSVNVITRRHPLLLLFWLFYLKSRFHVQAAAASLVAVRGAEIHSAERSIATALLPLSAGLLPRKLMQCSLPRCKSAVFITALSFTALEGYLSQA